MRRSFGGVVEVTASSPRRLRQGEDRGEEVVASSLEGGAIPRLSSSLAQLSSDDMIAVNNMRYLGGYGTKKSSRSGFTLKFDAYKELIEKLSKGELPKDEYPCMNDPSSSFHKTSQDVSATTTHHAPAQSMRSRRATWARSRSSDDGYSRYAIIPGIFHLNPE
ncbi:hypothetical protein GW17_00005760 [Ensete ventricosum]|nr:hypothetical protein GW17_00005760 [Ensete ventricosum]